MNYPYGQQPGNPGPQYQQQPAYPQQSGYPPQQGFPQQGYSQPGYPAPGYPPAYPPPAPSGGTAITAAVLATLLGLLAGLAGVVMIGVGATTKSKHDSYGSHSSSASDGLSSLMLGLGVVVIVMGVLWFAGAMLLFARKAAGRWMLVVLSSLGLIGNVISVANSSSPGSGAFGGLLGLAVLVLAAVPATGKWIAAGKPQSRSPYPPAGGYTPYPY
ncbi:hypothetical protein AB0N05_20445 [Nocardia sp. NPDC051030]|uniref:hypothetical protein n=1 Tax=Nocardia sp. NPDC051030 TaxID=3155162 RepID=UPI00342FC3CC